MSTDHLESTTVSRREAAELLGVSLTRVDQRLKDGTLRGERMGGRWQIDQSSVRGCLQRAALPPGAGRVLSQARTCHKLATAHERPPRTPYGQALRAHAAHLFGHPEALALREDLKDAALAVIKTCEAVRGVPAHDPDLLRAARHRLEDVLDRLEDSRAVQA